jgi:hypothetical protein
MGAMFASPKKPKIIPPPTTSDQAITDVAAEARKRAASMRNRASTEYASKGLGYVNA